MGEAVGDEFAPALLFPFLSPPGQARKRMGSERVRKSVKALRETFTRGVLDSLSEDGFCISYRLRLWD